MSEYNLETVKIVAPSDLGYALINKSDYDETVKKAKEAEKKGDDPIEVPELYKEPNPSSSPAKKPAKKPPTESTTEPPIE
jgi:hypothetical protein